MHSSVIKGHAAMAAAAVMWGFMPPVCKLVVQGGEVSALSLAAMRIGGACVLFWLVSLLTKRERVRREDLKWLFLAALCGVVLNQGMFTCGMGLTSPADAAIMATTAPIVTMIMSAMYLKERVTGKKVAGIMSSASGALLLVLGSAQASSSGNVWGDLLCLASQVSVSFYFVFFKGLISRYSPVTLMKWMFLFAALCSLPPMAGELAAIPFGELGWECLAGIGYVVGCATFVCYLLMPIAQRALRPTAVCMYNYVQPVIATLAGVAWGLESFGWWKAAAVSLIFAGVSLVVKSNAKGTETASSWADKAGSMWRSMRLVYLRRLRALRRMARGLWSR